MEKVTFLQSLIKILKLISSIPFFIEILILTVFLLIIMIFFYFRKSKKGKITSLIIYFVTLFLLPISHFSFFVDTADKIIENFVAIIYFPSCYVYIATLLITDFSTLLNVIKNTKDVKKGKWYQALEIVYFFLFQFLFFLIVRVVITEDIDIFTRTSLYSDANLTSLIQISSYLFWIRIGIRVIAFIIDRLSKFSFKSNRKDKKESFTDDVAAETNDLVEMNLNDVNTSNNDSNIAQLNEFINVSNEIIGSSSNASISKGNNTLNTDNTDRSDKVGNKVVKPLEVVEGDLFNINNYDNVDVNIDNNLEKLEINNNLYNVEPLQQDIKSPYDFSEHDAANINNNINNNINALDSELEVLDLSEDADKDDNIVVETLNMNEVYPYQQKENVFSTKAVEKNNVEDVSAEKKSPFDILKEAEQYVPISQEQYKLNNNIDLTIDNSNDDNDNYFDDFYE